jgi:hypothetical protein
MRVCRDRDVERVGNAQSNCATVIGNSSIIADQLERQEENECDDDPQRMKVAHNSE